MDDSSSSRADGPSCLTARTAQPSPRIAPLGRHACALRGCRGLRAPATRAQVPPRRVASFSRSRAHPAHAVRTPRATRAPAGRLLLPDASRESARCRRHHEVSRQRTSVVTSRRWGGREVPRSRPPIGFHSHPHCRTRNCNSNFLLPSSAVAAAGPHTTATVSAAAASAARKTNATMDGLRQHRRRRWREGNARRPIASHQADAV